MLEAQVEPVAPFSLRAVTTWPDPTRRVHGGVLEVAFATAAGPARARVWQPADGAVRMRISAADEAVAHDRLVEMLGLRVDHRPFLEVAAADPLLRPMRGRLTGMRPWQLSSPEHALVRAISGQLIRASEAIRIERRILRDVCPPFGDMHLPVDAAMLAGAHPARFERAGTVAGPGGAAQARREASLEHDGRASRATGSTLACARSRGSARGRPAASCCTASAATSRRRSAIWG